MDDHKVRLGVVFYFALGEGKEPLQAVVKDGDEPINIDLGSATIQAGIYPEIVPSDSGKAGEYDEIKLPKVAGKQVFTNKDVYVFGEPALEIISVDDSQEEKARKFHVNKAAMAQAVTCRVTIMLPPLDKRTHPDGRICGECKYFNRRRGQEELKAITHHYVNGTMSMTEEIIKLMCDQQKVPNLSADIVGHCPIRQELCSVTSPACEDSFEPIEVKNAPEVQVTGRS